MYLLHIHVSPFLPLQKKISIKKIVGVAYCFIIPKVIVINYQELSRLKDTQQS